MSGARDLLVGSASSLFESLCTRETLDRAEEGLWAEELWAAIDEAGLQDGLAAEEHGGAGMSFGDAMSVLRVAGRYAAPVPLAEGLLVGWLRSSADLELPAGPAALLVATRRRDVFSLQQQNGGWLAEGSIADVPYARFAKTLVCVTEVEESCRLVEIDAGACRIEEAANIAGEPRDEVHFESVRLDDSMVTVLPPEVDADLVRSRWALTRAAMMSGALEYLLEISVEYARERMQFGRPIGRFQAIQQQLAVMAGEVAAATAAAAAAAEEADLSPAIVESAIAKARVGEAAGIGTAIAHQVHGAIGYTHEHDLHTRSRRLWAWRDELGSEGDGYAVVGRHYAGLGPSALWPELTGTG